MKKGHKLKLLKKSDTEKEYDRNYSKKQRAI